jgi:L-iditol 2-dehydrogenase
VRLARYIGNGRLAIVDEDAPVLPEGGLIVRTEACALCSGELMEWYMDRKIPHVIGHEVCGVVAESDDTRFPVGSRVFPHHHAPCMQCELCIRGLYVHCPRWKSTKLVPGGMSEIFAVPAENLNDTLVVDDLRPQDAALIEPLACVVKAIRSAGEVRGARTAVIGLGVMGLMHAIVLPGSVGYEINDCRIEWAKGLALDARRAETTEPADFVFVCPGSQAALDLAVQMLAPGGTIVLFAPMPPSERSAIDLNSLYFRDARIVSSYSCGPNDTLEARRLLAMGQVRAEQVVSHFVALEDLPWAYQAMKSGEILKPMVIFQ